MDNGVSVGPDSFPISPQQARVWEAEPDGPAARVQGVLSIEGPLEPAAIADALRACVARHEVLRTTFTAQAGLRLPLQVVAERLDPHVQTVAVNGPERELRLAEVRAADMATPMDAGHGPLVRASILTTGTEAFALVLTISALCADGASAALMLAEVASTLACAELVQDPLQYADFAAWQQELSESEDEEAGAARAFWSEAAGAVTPPLPFAREDGSQPLQEVAVAIDETLTTQLAEQAARYGTDLAAAVQAAWHVVLGRYAGEETTHCAYLAAKRRHSDLDGAVGAFARPVPLALRVEGSRAFAEVLADVAQTREQALVNQDYAPAEGNGLDVGFAEYPVALDQPQGVSLRISSMLCAGPELRLLAMCGTDGKRLAVTLAFDPARYRRQTVEGLADGVLNVLATAAGDPSAALGGIDLLSEQGRARVLREFNDTAAPLPAECVHELFARHAQSAPERTAVSDGESRLSYGELEASANRLARRLRSAGVGPDVTVGLCTDRSVQMIVGLLGILKAGGTYVPLHYEHPPARLSEQLAAAQANTVVTQEGLLERLHGFEGELVCLDRDRDSLEGESAEPLQSGVGHQHRAYVIFTSGSTGAPKGVDVTHGNLVNYTADIVARLGAEDGPLSFGLVTSVSTDLGNTSVYGALCSGGTLVLVSPATAGDPGALAALMADTPVDVLKITPSHIGALLVAEDAGVLPRRWLVLGGERASWDLIERVRRLSACAILNHYGPTETTVGSCTFPVGEGAGEFEPASVPIGRPISNTACYVLEPGGTLAPIGVTGRLLIGGAGVARGYVGAPELTSERFFADPFGAGGEPSRVYDTGDLARWLPDGTLEFMGRMDEQVKIRGYRVEPAEVDSALKSHVGVREAITVAHALAGGETRLVAYCTVEQDVEKTGLLEHLAQRLPEYMLPGAIVLMEEMPRGPSGKINRLLLPDPDLVTAEGADYVAPRTPLEEAVAAIWAQVLGMPRVSVEDDFFALGGHSLLATQVVAQVRSDFAVDLPLHSLFTSPTVTSLAAEIVAMMGDSEGDETAELMASLEGMSDEEAERLLAEELQPGAGQG